MLANQQRDGDSPIQNIVTGLREKKSRERITNGLRSFIAQDNHCAVEVGHLRKGQRPFQGLKKNRKYVKIIQGVLREGAADLTPRAEEVDTLIACINVDHIGENFGTAIGGRRLAHLLAKQLMKELKEVSGKSCIITEI